MVILNNGLTKIRDLHFDDMSEADFGDDGSAVAVTQTGVQSAVTGGSNITITKTKGSFSNQFTASLDSATATGNTIREVSYGNGTINYDRSVFPGVEHTTNDELIIIKTYSYERGE
jgi:hypothetical protein